MYLQFVFLLIQATASKSELLQPPPLAYKKWALLEHDSVADHVACGELNSIYINPFNARYVYRYMHFNPCAAGRVYMRLQARFRPNKMPLKSII